MSVAAVNKSEIVKNYQRSEKDTGSSEVQIALLTARIKHLTQHLGIHAKDKHSRRGLITLVNKRRKLLTYIKKVNPSKYLELLKRLELRK
tara:strand:- start:125 stop:394 length:270 start_codon:yes stop_codon:yes gene_type:complete